MSSHSNQSKHDRSLNIQVSWELKQALEELAQQYDRTLATVVRSLLRIGIPVLHGIWEAEAKMLDDPSGLFHRSQPRRDDE
ncbi:MAG: hypothetical protein E4G91_04405 [Candidatus Zixiibacteriota bacterium]|nr:MAG: hypothetical protein E4G91_04405 [candidate division Zixibacteria bacterium]